MVDVSSCTDATAAMLEVCAGHGGFVWFRVAVYMKLGTITLYACTGLIHVLYVYVRSCMFHVCIENEDCNT